MKICSKPPSLPFHPPPPPHLSEKGSETSGIGGGGGGGGGGWCHFSWKPRFPPLGFYLRLYSTIDSKVENSAFPKRGKTCRGRGGVGGRGPGPPWHLIFYICIHCIWQYGTSTFMSLFLCVKIPLPSDVGFSRENIDENTKIVPFRGPYSSQRFRGGNMTYEDSVFVSRMDTEDNLFETIMEARNTAVRFRYYFISLIISEVFFIIIFFHGGPCINSQYPTLYPFPPPPPLLGLCMYLCQLYWSE